MGKRISPFRLGSTEVDANLFRAPQMEDKLAGQLPEADEQ
jgi:hypothetical protein